MDVNAFFTRADLEAIEAAVVDAESRSAGEVVPYVVSSSADYDVAGWTAAALGALGASLAAALAFQLGGIWPWTPLLWVAFPPVVGALLGLLATIGLPGLRRVLIPAEQMAESVELRAHAAFVEREVFATRDRTGILIFLSLFERRVVILADSGIKARVRPAAWEAIAAAIADGMRRGEPGAALATGIRRAGELLVQHGVPRRPDDVNELDDRLHTESGDGG